MGGRLWHPFPQDLAASLLRSRWTARQKAPAEVVWLCAFHLLSVAEPPWEVTARNLAGWSGWGRQWCSELIAEVQIAVEEWHDSNPLPTQAEVQARLAARKTDAARTGKPSDSDGLRVINGQGADTFTDGAAEERGERRELDGEEAVSRENGQVADTSTDAKVESFQEVPGAAWTPSRTQNGQADEGAYRGTRTRALSPRANNEQEHNTPVDPLPQTPSPASLDEGASLDRETIQSSSASEEEDTTPEPLPRTAEAPLDPRLDPELRAYVEGLEAAGLNRKQVRVLYERGLRSFADLSEWTAKELREIPGLGTKAVRALRWALQQRGSDVRAEAPALKVVEPEDPAILAIRDAWAVAFRSVYAHDPCWDLHLPRPLSKDWRAAELIRPDVRLTPAAPVHQRVLFSAEAEEVRASRSDFDTDRLLRAMTLACQEAQAKGYDAKFGYFADNRSRFYAQADGTVQVNAYPGASGRRPGSAPVVEPQGIPADTAWGEVMSMRISRGAAYIPGRDFLFFDDGETHDRIVRAMKAAGLSYTALGTLNHPADLARSRQAFTAAYERAGRAGVGAGMPEVSSSQQAGGGR